MSRLAKKPVSLPKGVSVNIEERHVTVKGQKGELTLALHEAVKLEVEDEGGASSGQVIFCRAKNGSEKGKLHPMVGTTQALLKNCVVGVHEGYEKTLELVGVGYRAQAQGKKLNLSLGFSHPVSYDLPEGVTAETPSNTQVLLKSINKQLLGQVAANIRSIRPPEPYKGKGVRYSGETIVLKETKKK